MPVSHIPAAPGFTQESRSLFWHLPEADLERRIQVQEEVQEVYGRDTG